MDRSTVPSASTHDSAATLHPGLSDSAVRARLDPPHPSDPTSSGTPPEPAAQELCSTTAAAQQEMLQRHAAELADHLRRWEADLARRERNLHEQISAWELEQRQFRLWMQQTQCQLEQQREALERLRAAGLGDPFEFPA